jgi:hypothetical protein
VNPTVIGKIFEAAAKVSNEWSLGAFAMAALVAMLWLSSKQRRKYAMLAGIAFVGVVILGALPMVAGAYYASRGVYRVRITVLDDRNTPTEEAKVWSTTGGEPKKIQGVWEFDIPAAAKPLNGKFTVYAALEASFLRGHAEYTLARDFSPALTVSLSHDTSAELRGTVVDRRNRPLAGVRVWVVGFDAESAETGPDGGFRLAAHAADGQQVEIYAHTARLSVNKWCQAGNSPVTIVLR